MDNKKVPLVWQHQHNDPGMVLGHAILENRAFGVFCHGYFNGTEAGRQAKEMVKHKDVEALSIFANNLNERRVNGGKEVIHGDIKEVSLVLAGANPGAVIENVNIVHGDSFETLDDEAYIFNEEDLVLEHSDETPAVEPVEESAEENPEPVEGEGDSAPIEGDENPEDPEPASDDEDANAEDNSVQEVLDSLNEEQSEVVHGLLESALAHANGAELKHADESMQAVFDTLTGTQKIVVHHLIGEALAHADDLSEGENMPTDDNNLEHADQRTVQDVFDSLSEEQKAVVFYMIGEAVKAAEDTNAELAQSGISDEDKEEFLAHFDNKIQEGFDNMKHNLFEQNGDVTPDGASKTLTHAQFGTIVDAAKNTFNGSLKEAIAHAAEYGFEDIDILFPDAKNPDGTPQTFGRRTEWVNDVLTTVRTTPFSRIKTVVADITADEARAKGYVKGNMKKDEVIKLLKRVTTPTTIYKKQKLDRDDTIDITDFNVVAWLKAEMRLMLDEELARAILLGDGREIDDEDKVDEDHIRPVAHDDAFYAHVVTLAANTEANDIVEAVLYSRRNYKGTGNPTFYTTDAILTDLILQKDKVGRRLFETEESLAAALRVRKIVTVEVMEGYEDIVGILVNLADYTVGADAGGRIGMYDDFDIDYNQFKYLIETRVSGALTVPKSAIVIKKDPGIVITPTQPAYNASTHVITIPTQTGTTYYIDNVAKTDGATVTITQSTEVEARPDSGYSFPHGTDNDWYFQY
jgi:hypothetical protein